MEKRKITSDYLERSLLALDQEKAEEIILQAAENETAEQVANELISDTLRRIGERWEKGELALSQVYISGIICEKIIDKIMPPSSPKRKNQPKTAIAVFEDFHLLGKRIIYATLRAAGIELLDLGGGLSARKIADIVRRENIKILLISVLMLPSAMRLKELKEMLSDVDVKIIVGGAPFRFDSQLWKETGADYYGKDSSEALKIVTKLMEDGNGK